MIRRPPRSTQSRSSAASDVYKRQRVDVCDVGDESLQAKSRSVDGTDRAVCIRRPAAFDRCVAVGGAVAFSAEVEAAQPRDPFGFTPRDLVERVLLSLI